MECVYSVAEILYISGIKARVLAEDWESKHPDEDDCPDWVFCVDFYNPDTKEWIPLLMRDIDEYASEVDCLLDKGFHPFSIELFTDDEEWTCLESRSWRPEGTTIEEDAALYGEVITEREEHILLGTLPIRPTNS